MEFLETHFILNLFKYSTSSILTYLTPRSPLKCHIWRLIPGELLLFPGGAVSRYMETDDMGGGISIRCLFRGKWI